MYDYSPIHKIYIRNFRNLGDVEIDFTDSPIVTLVGENEAGKTSVIKAVATCALHANPRDQKDFIRDNTKMFGVAIELEDGKRVTRIKELSGINSYQITDASGNVLYSTTKLSEGLPVEVQKLMGLISEPETNEFLHIRTYEDRLLFVVTPNSTNYKVMYNALKVEQLTKAIKLGSNEANRLKSQINENEISIQTLGNQARAINIVDTEPLTNVKNRLISQISVLDKLEKAKDLMNKVNACERQLGALALINKFNLVVVNEVLANKLNSANRLINKYSEASNLLSSVSKASSLQEIDVSIVSKIKNIIVKENKLNEKIKDAGALVHISTISDVSETSVMLLNKVKTLTSKIKTSENELQMINTDNCSLIAQNDIDVISRLVRINTLSKKVNANKDELDSINTYIEQVIEYIKQCGVAFETCPKCGEAVVFDVDKLNKQIQTHC